MASHHSAPPVARRAPSLAPLRLLLALAALVLYLLACTVAEGDRCNPARQPDECSSGLSCTVPSNCVLAACCPPPEKITASTNIACQACADTSDAGAADGAADDAADGAPDGGADAAPE